MNLPGKKLNPSVSKILQLLADQPVRSTERLALIEKFQLKELAAYELGYREGISKAISMVLTLPSEYKYVEEESDEP